MKGRQTNHASLRQCHWAQLHREEVRITKGDQSMTITWLSSGIKSHVICLILVILQRLCHILVQFSSSMRWIICSEPQCSALCPCSRLKSLSEISSRLIRVIAVTFICLIQADRLSDSVNSSAIKAAQDASSASATQPSQVQEDVIVLSAGPIMVINTQDQEAAMSALLLLLRTEVALSELQVSSHGDEDSIVKFALRSCLPNSRMDMCHLSEDVKYFVSSFKGSGGSFDFKEAHRFFSGLMLGSSSFDSIMCLKFLESKGQVTASLGSSISVWKEVIYHMTYLTVSHGIRHQVAQLATANSNSQLKDMFDCRHSWMTFWFSRVNFYWDWVVEPQSSCRITFNFASQCQSQIGTSAGLSHSLSITGQRTWTKKSFVHASLSPTPFQHLLSVNIRLRHGTQNKASQSSRSNHHSMWSQWSSHRTLMVWIRWHQAQCHQNVQDHQDQTSMSNLRWSTSGDQHQKIQLSINSSFYEIHNCQVLIKSAWTLVNLIVIKYGSENQKHHCSASMQQSSDPSAQQLVLIVKWGLMMRSPFMVFSRESVKCSGSSCHGLMWLKTEGFSDSGLSALLKLHLRSHRHHITS